MTNHHADEGPGFDPDNRNDLYRVQAFIWDVQAAISDFFKSPPAGVSGRYLEDQRSAWEEFSEGWLQRLEHQLHSSPIQMFEGAGLMFQAGRAKFRLWADARKEFLNLRNSRRASRMCHIGVSILSSLAGILNAGEPLKEALEGIKYITDLAIQEGGA